MACFFSRCFSRRISLDFIDLKAPKSWFYLRYSDLVCVAGCDDNKFDHFIGMSVSSFFFAFSLNWLGFVCITVSHSQSKCTVMAAFASNYKRYIQRIVTRCRPLVDLNLNLANLYKSRSNLNEMLDISRLNDCLKRQSYINWPHVVEFWNYIGKSLAIESKMLHHNQMHSDLTFFSHAMNFRSITFFSNQLIRMNGIKSHKSFEYANEPFTPNNKPTKNKNIYNENAYRID